MQEELVCQRMVPHKPDRSFQSSEVTQQSDSNMENTTPVSCYPAVTHPCCWCQVHRGPGGYSCVHQLRNSICRKLHFMEALRTRVQNCFSAKMTQLLLHHQGWRLKGAELTLGNQKILELTSPLFCALLAPLIA